MPKPELGVIAAWQAATDAYVYIYNPVGFERMMLEADHERMKVVRDAGLEPPLGLNDMHEDSAYTTPYTDFQRLAFERDGYVSASDDEGRRQNTLQKRTQAASRNDEQWRTLKAAHPELNIPDNEEMRQGVIARGRAMVERWEGGKTTWGGMAGGLAGTVAGSMTDPVQAIAAIVSAGGSTALARIGIQFGLGSGAEAIDLGTGTLENMRWFGLDPSTGELATQIGVAGVLPAALQGVGEGLSRAASAYARRAARKAPTPLPRPPVAPPEPTPSPVVARPISAPQLQGVDAALARYSDVPFMPVRAAKDADAMDAHINQWGNTPQDAPPPTIDTMTSLATPTRRLMDTTAIRVAAGATPNGASLQVLDDIARTEGLYQAAANLDPQVFKSLEKLTEQLRLERERKVTDINLIHDRLMNRTDTHDTLASEQVAVLMNPKASAAAKTRAAERIEELAKIRDKQKTPDISAQLDRELEAKIAKLTPAVERALARAQGVWELTERQRATLAAAAKDGELAAAVRAIQKAPASPRLTPHEVAAQRIPELNAPEAMPFKTGEPIIDTVDRVNVAAAKQMDDDAEAFLATTKKALQSFEEKQAVELPGDNNLVHATDESGVLDADGRPMTMKQAYEDLEADKEALQGVMSCQTL